MAAGNIEDVRNVLADASASGQDAARATRAFLAAQDGPLDPADACDLLERAACFGRLEAVQALWEGVGDFAYASWALALALRCAHEDVARFLLGQGVDLLDAPHRPAGWSGRMPTDERLTRFALTRRSPTLFLNPMDPTAADAVFAPFRRSELLAGSWYEAPTDLAGACACVADLADEELFGTDAFSDLARAAAVRAWHALRHASGRDEAVADACLGLVRHLIGLARDGRAGDASAAVRRLEGLLGALIVPRAPLEVCAFVTRELPQAFFDKLAGEDWLSEDQELVDALADCLDGGTPEGAGQLLELFASWGDRARVERVLGWHAADAAALAGAATAAADAGHAEISSMLLRAAAGARDASGTGDAGMRGQDGQAPSDDGLASLLL